MAETKDKHTETLPYSDYQVRRSRKSKFVDGLVIDDPKSARTRCPRCEAYSKIIHHGGTSNCPKCNLHMQVFGNALIISEGAA